MDTSEQAELLRRSAVEQLSLMNEHLAGFLTSERETFVL